MVVRLVAILGLVVAQAWALSEAPSGQHQLLGQQQAQPFSLPGTPSPAVDAMLSWIRQNGGIVNVAVREVPGQGRVTVAPHHIAPGDILAAIPRKACFAAAKNEWDSAAALFQEMQNASSPLAPYMQGLPLRSQVASYYDIPSSYLPLIQNDAMVSAIQQVQQQLGAVAHSVSQRWRNMELPFQLGPSEMRYTISLLKTRSFDCAGLGELLVPVVDLANHRNGCKHSITSYLDCGPQSPGGCVVWRAEEAVPAGTEVCNTYHTFMLQDRALLQYGMLQEDAAAHIMSGIDRHDFDPKQPWSFQAGHETRAFNGTATEMRAEISRLSSLLASMQAQDRTLRTQPDAADADGSLLQKLRTWRDQRQVAIAAEIARLQRLVHGQQ